MIRKDWNFCGQILRDVATLDKKIKNFRLFFFHFSFFFFGNSFPFLYSTQPLLPYYTIFMKLLEIEQVIVVPKISAMNKKPFFLKLVLKKVSII